ncbi:alpha/beta fold hydrolase [Streptomyces sp. NPDC059650]|uniref:alpha/beta fold hydrolase n=1 Tax=Streptomyces sp. NPDC059650 TaxID=3346896 RepID=UPI0036B005BB
MSKPAIVLVHGAFADASSWAGVTRILQEHGYPVVAIANPLRGLRHDALYLRCLLTSVPGPVVLVGHSYGGAVISEAATGLCNVIALVFVAALTPDEGESCADLDARYGGPAVRITQPLPLPIPPGEIPARDGPPNIELFIDPAQFGTMFAPDTDPETASCLAASQRPVALAALTQKAVAPGWKTVPCYFAVATDDRMIPAWGQREMAARIGAITVEVPAGHAAMLGQPDPIARLILMAAEDS